ncbi:MAG: hypothetical protein N0E48_10195, partial [Candidatus Thiodiazotropha endolucinida]|nr:hypothetical protein [Candidatus Thiodiazotropha taylori]MCW4343716.1 hypothetical protein [Candidatus Thiodiazotropha endolucinida]
FDIIAEMDEAEQQQMYLDTAEMFDDSLLDNHPSNTTEAAVGYFDDVEATFNGVSMKHADKNSAHIDKSNAGIQNGQNNEQIGETRFDYNEDDLVNKVVNANETVFSDISDADDEEEVMANNEASGAMNDDAIVHNNGTFDKRVLDVEHEMVHEDISDFDDISDVDVEVDAYNGDDYFNGSVNSDKGDGMSDGTEVIVISSDDDDNDETAVEISEMRVRTQTFVLTFQKQTKYIGNQAIQTSTSVERDYYEHYD